jgi:hypothetical protein
MGGGCVQKLDKKNLWFLPSGLSFDPKKIKKSIEFAKIS